MDFDDYRMQVLVSISKGCRPNSPKPKRSWVAVRPLNGIPEFGNAISSLLRAELIERRHRFWVRPSPRGYVLIGQWRAYRRKLKRRPMLYGQTMWDQPIELQLKQAA